MHDNIYADEVGEIIVSGPIVRFDLLIHSGAKDETSGKPTLVVQQRVIMPIDAFLRAVHNMHSSVQEMVKKGVITRAAKEVPALRDKPGTAR